MDQQVWHILRVSPGQEAAVAESISNAIAYFPTRAVRRFNRRYRAWSKYAEPLFPGYIFVDTDEPMSLHTFGASSHVRGYLRNGDRTYALISDCFLERVRAYERDLEQGTENLKHPFREGSNVYFTSGPLEGVEAVIEALKGLEGLKVNIVGSSFPIETTASQLREAPVA